MVLRERKGVILAQIYESRKNKKGKKKSGASVGEHTPSKKGKERGGGVKTSKTTKKKQTIAVL